MKTPCLKSEKTSGRVAICQLGSIGCGVKFEGSLAEREQGVLQCFAGSSGTTPAPLRSPHERAMAPVCRRLLLRRFLVRGSLSADAHVVRVRSVEGWWFFKAIKLFPSCHSLKITQGAGRFYISVYAGDLPGIVPGIVGRKASKHITTPRRSSGGYRSFAAVHVLALIIPSIFAAAG